MAGANQKYAVHYHIPSQQHVRVGRSTHRHLQDAQLHEISRYKSIQHCVSKWVIVVGGLVLPCHVLQTLCTVVFPVLLKNVTIIIINDVIFLLMKVQHNVAHLYNVVFSRSCLHWVEQKNICCLLSQLNAVVTVIVSRAVISTHGPSSLHKWYDYVKFLFLGTCTIVSKHVLRANVQVHYAANTQVLKIYCMCCWTHVFLENSQ